MKNIFEIKQQYLHTLQIISENEGEITPELEAMLDIAESELEEKAIQYALFIKKLESENAIIDSEMKRLRELGAKNDTVIEKLKDRVVGAMQLFGRDKIENPLLKLSLRKSESVNVLDESKLSDNFFTTKTTKSVSKTALKDAIKSGVDIAGAELMTNFNLQIK